MKNLFHYELIQIIQKREKFSGRNWFNFYSTMEWVFGLLNFCGRSIAITPILLAKTELAFRRDSSTILVVILFLFSIELPTQSFSSVWNFQLLCRLMYKICVPKSTRKVTDNLLKQWLIVTDLKSEQYLLSLIPTVCALHLSLLYLIKIHRI